MTQWQLIVAFCASFWTVLFMAWPWVTEALQSMREVTLVLASLGG
ncbi:MAG: hypothetical protein AAFR84_03005 [Pseudomonadota bacterium]